MAIPPLEHIDDALDLWLLDSGTRDSVVACARSADDVALSPIALDARFDQLIAFRRRIHLALRGRARSPSQKELDAFGVRLFRFLLPGDIRRVYEGLDSNTHIRLHLFTNLPQLQSIPWEYIRPPRRMPGPDANRPVVRIVPTLGFAPQPTLERTASRKLNVLFIAAEPTDHGPISWRADEEMVRAAFPTDQFTVETLGNASRESISRAFAKRDYHIVHFSGHGTVSTSGVGQVVLCRSGSAKSEYVRASDFAQLLSVSKVRLAVLAACDTGSGRFEDDFSVVAAALVRAGIPAVVANQAPVPDATMVDFVEILYTTLVSTGDIDIAVSRARNRLAVGLTSPGRVVLEWGIPTIYRHMRCARILRTE